mgnify:CR=1 FL=1
MECLSRTKLVGKHCRYNYDYDQKNKKLSRSFSDSLEQEEEFKPMHYEIDDETTIEAEEKLGRDMSYKDEINLLTKENEMSIEELKAMYYGGDGDTDTKRNRVELEVNGGNDKNKRN